MARVNTMTIVINPGVNGMHPPHGTHIAARAQEIWLDRGPTSSSMRGRGASKSDLLYRPWM